MATSMHDRLRLKPGEPVDLLKHDPRSTKGAPGDKEATLACFDADAAELADLQERLYAEGTRRVLLVLQGMDTSGKGGVIKHVAGAVDPLGLRISSFKKPTPEELKHHFLWRVRKAVPAAGFIGVFDRSHYEDVLIARVHSLAPPETIEKRYGEIARFERKLVDEGTTIVKCMLHISRERQAERLLARLDDPTKHWKFNPGDLVERKSWDAYMEAYTLALERCTIDVAPWYVVPSDRKWYRNWAIQQLLLETLRKLDPQYPKGDFDVAEMKAQLAAEK